MATNPNSTSPAISNPNENWDHLKIATEVAKDKTVSLFKSKAYLKLSNDQKNIVYSKDKETKNINVHSIRQVKEDKMSKAIEICSGKDKKRNFRFNDDHTFNQWSMCLKALVKQAHSEKTSDSVTSRAYKLWLQTDKNGDGALTFEEATKILQKLGIESTSSDQIWEIFNRYDQEGNGNGTLEWPEFLELFKEIDSSDSFTKDLFLKYGGLDGVMNRDELIQFLRDAQRDPTPEETADKVLQKYGHKRKIKSGTSSTIVSIMYIAEFSYFLYSNANRALPDGIEDNVTMDMTRPLQEYFICSSHNTYLEGNQLTGKSSVDAYLRTISLSARCVEVDIWDGKDGNPIITHGHTMTSEILLKDLLERLPEAAFVQSSYPVILSVENHCSPAQQAKIAQIINQNKALGPNVFRMSQITDRIPSPEELKGKYVIKCKIKSDSPPEWADLVALRGAPHFESLETSTQNKWYEMHSFGESKLKELLDTNDQVKTKFIEYHMSHLSRTYPAGARVDSSNYDPGMCFMLGAQVVALNFQKLDSALFAYTGTFIQNGRCGYVLKPEYMRVKPIVYPKRFKFRVRPRLGHNIPLRHVGSREKVTTTPCTYVTVGATCCVEKFEVQARSTRKVTGNLVNPVYSTDKNEWFEFESYDKDLTALVLKVRNDVYGKDMTLAVAALPIGKVRPGFRVVNLRDPTTGGAFKFAAHLLCEFELDLR